jgi:hypothetical protein
MTEDPTLAPLRQLVGSWTTEATHPAVPGVVVHGTATFEWVDGERFLTCRARTDHPDFPDALCVIGHMDQDRAHEASGEASPSTSALRMHYFDSRGVFRIMEMRITDTSWQLWRDAPGFSQRFTGDFRDGGDTIDGLWQLCRDDVHWADDLKITYRRQNGS